MDAEGAKQGVTIRPMQAQDAVAVGELVAQLGYERPLPEIRQWIQNLDAAAARQAAFVACMEAAVAGWIEVSIESRLQSAPFALIGGLVVRDGLRSLGIGRLLCQAAEQWARQRGLGKIRVTSRSTREDAHRFYLRDGYQMAKKSMVFEKTI